MHTEISRTTTRSDDVFHGLGKHTEQKPRQAASYQRYNPEYIKKEKTLKGQREICTNVNDEMTGFSFPCSMPNKNV